MKIVKKTSIIILALLTVTMVLPIAANAKNSYPQFPKMISGEEIYTITDEARAERMAMLDAAKKEVCRAYHNGEYDWDFDLDGTLIPRT